MDQGIQLAFQVGVVCAGLVDELRTFFWLAIERCMKQRLEALPEFGGHRVDESSCRSHARAMLQSRLTVLADRPSCSAISSNVNPAKKCSSRMSACLRSNSASRVNASSIINT